MATKSLKFKIQNLKWIGIVLVLFLSSCSLQKRLYTKGFYTSKHQVTKNKNKEDTLPSVSINNIKVKNKKADLLTSNSKLLILNSKLIDACDTIFLKDGTVILSKISEVYPTEVKYKYCDYADGPFIITNKADISYIVYTNGRKEDIASQYIPTPSYQTYAANDYQKNYRQKQKKNKANPFAGAGFITSIGMYGVASLFLADYATNSSSYAVNSYGVYYHQNFNSYLSNMIGTPTGGSTSFSWAIVAFFFAFLALAFCILAIYQISSRENKKGLGLAYAGAILSLLMIMLIVAVLLGLF